jgi:hypothetical protein
MCHLLTIVNDILTYDRTGVNRRLFKAQDQFEFTGPFSTITGDDPIIVDNPNQYDYGLRPCQKYYLVVCNDLQYDIPFDDVVESDVVIPKDKRDFDKVRNEQILIDPNNSYEGLVARPNPAAIRANANIVRFEI